MTRLFVWLTILGVLVGLLLSVGLLTWLMITVWKAIFTLIM